LRDRRGLKSKHKQYNFHYGLLGGSCATWNCSIGRSFKTCPIMSIHMGRAARAPVSLSPKVTFSSKPTHTPVVREGVNPRNHASVKSLVVPVLPARGRLSSRALEAVPSLIGS